MSSDELHNSYRSSSNHHQSSSANSGSSNGYSDSGHSSNLINGVCVSVGCNTTNTGRRKSSELIIIHRHLPFHFHLKFPFPFRAEREPGPAHGKQFGREWEWRGSVFRPQLRNDVVAESLHAPERLPAAQ